MKVTQIADFINTAAAEALGEEDLVQEDLGNIVHVGDTIENSMGLDNFVKKLNDVIGKDIMVNRVYKGQNLNILRDGWEFGSLLRKTNTIMPAAVENESWQLNDGQSYDPNIYYQPTVSTKFYNDAVTWEIDLSFAEEQVKSAFHDAQSMNAFMSMLHTSITNSMTVKTDELTRRALNNLISHVIHANDGVTYIKLRTLYNAASGQSIASGDAFMRDKEAMKFAVSYLYNYKNRLAVASTLFNQEHTQKFTPADRLNFTVLADFENAARVYLDSDTYHNELVQLPNHEVTTYWQGSGDGFEFSDVSKIDVKNSYGDTVQASNIVATMFDRDAVAVCNTLRKTNSNFNPKADFYTEFHKYKTSLFTDSQENMIVFSLN